MDKSKKDLNTEQRILAAAKQAFMEKGLDGARMQDIADKAGINKALLHYYFRSKDKLFEMIFLDEAVNFLPQMTGIIVSESTVFEKIELFVSMYITMLIQNPYMPLFILNELNRNPQMVIKKIWGNKRPPIEEMAANIEKEVKKGIIKPVKAHALMLNMVSMCMFPFIARPMVQWITKTNDAQFMQMMEARKKEIATLIIDSIRK